MGLGGETRVSPHFIRVQPERLIRRFCPDLLLALGRGSVQRWGHGAAYPVRSERHRPETTLLYRVVERHYPDFLIDIC